MRMYLKCALQWVLAIALIQVALYYWAVNRKGHQHKHTTRPSPGPHPYIMSMRNHADGTCSYDTCPKVKEGVFNVHLVPHSHIDVGWLKSVDEYYTGKGDGDYGNTLYAGCVQCILNSTIQELIKNPERTFIFAEMKYFARFWEESSQQLRDTILQLIRERRLEIVNGGWVMSDAGITMYNDIIDQHTLGFDFIREHLGACAQTRTGWHVDQFGHSSEHASIFAQMGYDALFVGRISDSDKAKRKSMKDLEMVWMTSQKNLGSRSALFTHVTFDGYYAPQGYVLENLKENAFRKPGILRNFLVTLENRAMHYKTNHLLVPMGSDFGYRNPELWFKNMDDAIHLTKAGRKQNVNLIYSTPSCYAYHVYQEMLAHRKRQESLPEGARNPPLFSTKLDDFLPYVTDVVWTGFYTTRGGLKRHIWQAGQILQSCKQLAIFSGLKGTFQRVNTLRDAMAVMQHHDAITGTQKKAVLANYNQLLSNATEKCEQVMADVYKTLWGKDIIKQIETPEFCPRLNISSCDVSEEADEFLVTVYNHLSWSVQLPLRMPVEPAKYFVYDKDKKLITHQVVPVPEGIQSIPERPLASAPTELTFMASVPPLSISSFLVKTDVEERKVQEPELLNEVDAEIVIENEHLSLTFNQRSGLLVSITNKASKLKIDISQDFAYYNPSSRNEGAYVFMAGTNPATLMRKGRPVAIKVIRGDVVQEVHQSFDQSVTQVVRLYKDSAFAEFHWTVGRLNLDNSFSGVDVVSQFKSTLDNGKIFYTDSNGRDMIKRTRDSWQMIPDFKISGNYFPVTSRIFIRDEAKRIQLTLFPDRPQGGTSLVQGSVELMVHRRSYTDDGLGMQEPLNDLGSDREGIIYTGKHYLLLDTMERSSLAVRHKAWETQLAPTVMFTEIKQNQDLHKALEQYNFLNPDTIPKNVHLMTLDRILENDTALLLIRLEHALERDDISELNKESTLHLENLFQPFDIVSAEETTLGGNFNPQEVERLEWVSEKGVAPKYIGFPDFKAKMVPPFSVTLTNMAIRTFRVKIAYNEGFPS
ncbi:alpha-mannosidase [Plakobranchus ocellatus]|uniref:Alpha-mannosidase n=1 Tax=Plakobranchus ocellatus TaxID=259542 RepID=A0AAV3ZP53_9GAST|nr:alpha-mannosidase [Plakobranchus ocellatus]